MTPSVSFSSTSRSSSASSSSSQAPSIGWRIGAHDLRVLGLRDELVSVPEHLVHLLAVAGADELDLDLVLGAARELDHLPGEVEDLHRLAHVEDVDLAAAAHRARPGSTSEAASGMVMKYRVISGWVTVTGPPRSIWRRKIGITEPGRAEDVAEADRDEAGRDVVADARTTRRSIRRPPSTGRAGSSGLAALSVEMKTKLSTPNSTATCAIDAGREHVVADRLQRVRLEHRHVLVGGGVEDDVRRVASRRPARIFGGVAAVGEDRDHGGEVALVDELPLDLVERRLGLLDEHELGGAEADDLAAELGADRAAAAGDRARCGRGCRRRSRRGRPRPARGRGRPRPGPGGSGPARLTSPEISSCSPGSVLTGMPSARVTSTILRRSSPGAEGIAISTSSGRWSRRTWPSSSVVPSTRTPWMREVLLARRRRRRSRSGCRASWRLRCISRTTSWPALPAPTTRTSLPRATMPLVGRSISERARSRVPATNASSRR